MYILTCQKSKENYYFVFDADVISLGVHSEFEIRSEEFLMTAFYAIKTQLKAPKKSNSWKYLAL